MLFEVLDQDLLTGPCFSKASIKPTRATLTKHRPCAAKSTFRCTGPCFSSSQIEPAGPDREDHAFRGLPWGFCRQGHAFRRPRSSSPGRFVDRAMLFEASQGGFVDRAMLFEGPMSSQIAFLDLGWLPRASQGGPGPVQGAFSRKCVNLCFCYVFRLFFEGFVFLWKALGVSFGVSGVSLPLR